MAYPRASRLNEEMKKHVSHIIRNELKDPRICSMTSVIAVDVTRDLRYATVYISVLGSEIEKNETITGLEKSAGYVRREVGKKIKARYTPEIIFKLDESIEKGIDMYHKISNVNKTEKTIKDENNEDINE